jgi:DNA-directed RNA polymerase subunit RPC12/RpoP
MSSRNTPNTGASVLPQPSPTSGEERSGAVCPYCTQKINYLMTMIVSFYEFHIEGDGTSEISPVSDEKVIFYCPKCGAEIATTREEAIEFLKGEWDTIEEKKK